MNVLSLFDGKSSGYTAMELAGLPITNYYSSEVDKYAIQVSNAIHPNQTRLGDVAKWREWDIDWDSIDLILAGSPCQGFSFAGKQLAFDDPRSALFFTFVDILNHVKSLNPGVKFMLENVKMKKEYLDVISEHVGVEPVFINSALVSAQNRQRYYWANGGEIVQPGDRGFLLADIIENEPENTTFMSKRFCQRNKHILRDDFNGKAKSLSAMEYVKNGRQGDYIACKSRNDNFVDVENSKYSDRCKKQILKNSKRPNEKSIAVCTNSNLTGSGVNVITFDDKHYRKLTPRECFRLQTVPEHYVDKILSCGVSNTQLYKIAGNGWTDEVVAHNLRCMFGVNK